MDMDWRDELLGRLAAATPGGYSAKTEPASEPTALAGLALLNAGNDAAVARAADWLAARQANNGAVGVTPSQATPCWPTSLAILLWQATGDPRYRPSIDRAVAWALQEKGETHMQRDYVGHDTMLVGWSWAADTHSWLEPTAMFVMALKAVGKSQHPRTREAVRLLVDRLLPHGGCNYGNTLVLGQELLPHVQPTGIVMMALADEQTTDPRLEQALEYLERELSVDTTTASLCYGLLGLAANKRNTGIRLDWLHLKYNQAVERDANCYKLALISFAASDTYRFGQQH
jgi:hypothetical protein